MSFRPLSGVAARGLRRETGYWTENVDPSLERDIVVCDLCGPSRCRVEFTVAALIKVAAA